VQLLVWLNSLALLPVIFTPDTVRTPLPVLLNITLAGELLVPATCDGKGKAVGETVKPGAGGVVFRNINTPPGGLNNGERSIAMSGF